MKLHSKWLARSVFTALAVTMWMLVATDRALSHVAPPVGGDVYAAKFLCGTFPGIPGATEGPVKPGNYQTAINVHNPSQAAGTAVIFTKKAVLLFDASNPPPVPELPMPPGQFVNAQLEANWGLEIDCNDIRTVLLGGAAPPAPTFIKGWVVITVASLAPLNVVTAYTAHGIDANNAPVGFSLDIQTIVPITVP